MLVIEVRDERRLLVIHYTGDVQTAVAGSFGSFGAGGSRQATIIEQEVELDLKTDTLEILGYSEREKVFSADEAIKRARDRAGEEEYSVFSNNCECFVNWAVTGKSISNQSNDGRWAAGAGALVGAVQSWKKEGSVSAALQGAVDGMKKGYLYYRENRS